MFSCNGHYRSIFEECPSLLMYLYVVQNNSVHNGKERVSLDINDEQIEPIMDQLWNF